MEGTDECGGEVKGDSAHERVGREWADHKKERGRGGGERAQEVEEK